MSTPSKKILIIGAGLGGLATAIRLAKAGHQVQVWERNHGPGGKLKEFEDDGFRWDTGPSLLTMPHIIEELFTDAGRKMEDYLTLHRLPSACRYFWRDGTVIDEDEAFWQRKDVKRFLRYAKGIYDVSAETYLQHPLTQFWRSAKPSMLPKLRHLPKLMSPSSMAQTICRFFKDPHLRQLFMRFATYNGSSPFLTPTVFNLIAYVEAHFGPWYVEGGMFQLPLALERVAQEYGVTFRYQTTVAEVVEGRATTEEDETEQFDYVICNGDCLQAKLTYLAAATSEDERWELERTKPSLSGLVFFFGVRGVDAKLGQHNIFFAEDYAREFIDIFDRRLLPTQPTIYINITSRSNPSHAPAGHENYFVLINAPGRWADETWPTETLEGYRNMVVGRLEHFGLENLDERIVTESIFTPCHFAHRDLAFMGALYGPVTHSIGEALLRPPMRSSVDPRVFFVGGTTHPGGGIPMVLLSGKMVAQAVERDIVKPRKRPVAKKKPTAKPKPTPKA